MNFKTIKVIIAREFLTRVKKKSFLLVTFLGPIFFAAIAIIPSLIMVFAEEDNKRIAYVDESGFVGSYLEDNNTVSFIDYTGTPADSVKMHLKEYDLDALITISAYDSLTRSVSAAAYSSSPVSVDMKMMFASKINKAVEDYRLGLYQIDGLKEIMQEVKSDVNIETYITGEDGREKISSSEVYMFISLILSMIIYMFIALFSGMVMSSVIEEKASRVVEVLVSSVKATELMFGKIIGVACVALTQFFLWVVLTAAIVFGVSTFVGFDELMAPAMDQTEQMMQIADGMGVDASALEATGMNMDMPDMAAQHEMSAVLQTLADINWVQLIFAFIVYFTLGYLLYASLFAAIGSAVENEGDTQQLQIPVTIPLLLAFFIAFYAFKAPDSGVVFWGSMIPFTSPIVMLARIPFGVPVWEIVTSIVLLLLTFGIFAYISAKIYKIGILMFGKKTTFKDLWKWLKMK